MKTSEVPKKRRTTRFLTFEYLDIHSDEVFRIRQCGEVAKAIGAPQRTVEHALWSLERDGLITKAGLEGLIWYGSHAAIDSLLSLRTDAVRL